MGPSRVDALLIGRDRSYTRRWLVIAAGLFIFSTVFTFYSGFIEAVFYPVGAMAAQPIPSLGFLIIWIGLSAWPAYQNEGLLGSWAVIFGPFVGSLSWYWVSGNVSGGSPLADMALALIAATAFTFTIGSAGFLIGMIVRRNTTRQFKFQFLDDPTKGFDSVSYRAALTGRSRTRSLSALVGSAVIFALTLVLTLGLYQYVGGLWGLRWWIAPVVLPLVAGAYAYWNDGFLVSLWLSSITAFAMYWGFINATSVTGPMVLWVLTGTTLITALPYGTAGYVGGRLLWQHRNPGINGNQGEEWLVELLIGQNHTRSAWVFVLTIGLFVLGFGVMLLIHKPGETAALQYQRAIRDYFRLADFIILRSNLQILALLLWLAFPAALAFWNDGYLPCWFLVFGAAYGVNVGQRFTRNPDIVGALFDPMFQVLVHALFLGTIGFVLGAGVKRAYRGARINRPDVQG